MNTKRLNLEMPIVVIFFAFLCVLVLSHANPLLAEPGRDGGFFMYAGKELVKGKTLYTDVWDSKGPLIFLINALGMGIGRGTRWGMWLLEATFLFSGALLAFSLMRRRWNELAALVGVTAALMGAKTLFDAGNSVEEYSLLFTWAALYAFYQYTRQPEKKWYPLVFGIALAANFWLRANLVGTVAVLLVIWFIDHYRRSGIKQALLHLLLVLAGVSIVTVPLLIYFFGQGTLNEMFSAAVVYNFGYSFDDRLGAKTGLPIWHGSLVPGFARLGWLANFGLVGWLLLLLQTLRGLKKPLAGPFDLVLILAWPVEVIASSISGRGFGHYYICWLPVLGLLVGYLTFWVNNHALSADFVDLVTRRKIWIPYAAGVLLFTVIFPADVAQNGQSFVQLLFQRSKGVQYTSLVANYVNKNSDSSDLVLVWGGQAGINVMANRNSIDAPQFYPMLSNSPQGQELQQRYLEKLMEQKPALIVDGYQHKPDGLPSLDADIRGRQSLLYPLADNTQAVLDYIGQHYTLEKTLDDYGIYRLKD